LTWFVGEVGPKQGGYTEFSVNVTEGAPHGTMIINFATVYFPSVPETTNTNGIVSFINRQPERVAMISGPIIGNAGSDYTYTASTTDPDNDQIKYTFFWDDSQTTESDFVDSGTEVAMSHSWANPGSYDVFVKATDTIGAESDNSNETAIKITLSPTAKIYVDIKPGSCPNSVNINSKGVIPVAILGTPSFNVRDMDPKTIFIWRDGIKRLCLSQTMELWRM